MKIDETHPLKKHEELLSVLLEELELKKIKKTGFKKSLIKYIKQYHLDDDSAIDSIREDVCYQPDAYYIDEETDSVLLFEAWNHHKTDMRKIYDLFWILDDVGMGLNLKTINQRGERFQMETCQIFISALAYDESVRKTSA